MKKKARRPADFAGRAGKGKTNMPVNLEKFSVLLKWAVENLESIEEIKASGDTAQVQLGDGRRGLLFLDGNGLPCISLPEAV